MSEFKNLPSGWKVVRLGEISSRVTRRNQDNRCQNVLTISAQFGLINQTDFFNKQVASKDLSNYILLKKGEFAYNKSYSTGYSFGAFKRLKFYEEGIASPLYIYFKFNDDVCSDFFEFYFDAGQANRQIKDIVQEGARNHGLLNLSIDDFFNIKIRMPNLDEQKKIAEILSTWDEAINLTINLIESKKQFKKALMQNLLTARIRFPRFKDEWEETKLGNIGVFKTSSVDKIIQKDECIVNLVNYMDVYKNTHINSNLKLSQTSASNREIENLSLAKGDVLFTPSSETPDDIGHSAVILSDMPNTLFSYHLVRFRLDAKNDIVFLGYVFNQDKILKQFARLSQGITRYTLSIRDFQNVFINFPNLNEQQKIAEVLTACDDEINLLNLKLENLKKQKQGLMQKLLSGKVKVRYV